jgi:hypothetical protein
MRGGRLFPRHATKTSGQPISGATPVTNHSNLELWLLLGATGVQSTAPPILRSLPNAADLRLVSILEVARILMMLLLASTALAIPVLWGAGLL